MKRHTIAVAALAILLGSFALPARADWFNYVVRTSGLAWSDGYHAYDQCPPKKQCHQHFFPLPAHGASANVPHEPYYFEKNESTAAPLPPAPTEANPLNSPHNTAPRNSTLPNPQAQYKPRSRYFQALEQNAQPQTLQARQPALARPY